MAENLQVSTAAAPADRLWRAIWLMEGYVHNVPGARPHDPTESIGLAMPHYSGGTLKYEFSYEFEQAQGMYLPRTVTQLMVEMEINGETVDIVAGEEAIELLGEDSALLDAPSTVGGDNVLYMAQRAETMLRTIRLARPDMQWWVDSGENFWGNV